MEIIENIKKIPKWQKIRYGAIAVSSLLFFAPFMLIPTLFGTMDFCGKLCMRRFYLYYPGMGLSDLTLQAKVSIAGATLLLVIILTTFFFGRLWCSHLCPVGGFPELVSRTTNQRIKIEYRSLPQVPLRYGYFGFYLVMMPMLGISACNFCNFVTIPRLFEAFGGSGMGFGFLLSSVGMVNLSLVALLGFFASKGRGFCAFMCPVGAIDGIVNRIGAAFRFTRRIRVERNRCNGCAACAQACMCGAIEMTDKKAVVDHLSCMSCHECVDVCNFGAIEYLVIPPDTKLSRKKTDEPLPPLPVWTTIHRPEQVPGVKGIGWQRIAFWSVVASAVIFIASTASAAQRKVDPDGCLSCHAFANLDYIDGDGILRSAYIDKSDYFASLHGSVPCRDCHRKIKEYPHDVKDGEVDCADTCHIEEPSKDEKYSHKAVIKEFERSVHKTGWTKGLTAGNRLKEINEPNPSCRRCHSNTPYIEESRMPKFREVFVNCDKECGTCHQGKAWRDQFGGHIIRRMLGGRWSKGEGNQMCQECHEDMKKMAGVEIKDEKTGRKEKVGPRFIKASRSYRATLHGKMIDAGDDLGASCIDCHSPSGLKHDIRRESEPKSSTHLNNLPATCGAGKCHPYSKSQLNAGFVATDMHDLDLISNDRPDYSSNWFRGAILLIPLSLITITGSIGWSLFVKKKGRILPFLGGNSFQRRVLKRKQVEPKKVVKDEGKDKGDGVKIAILLTFLLAPSEGISGNLYIESVEKGTVSQEEISDARKAILDHKEVKVIKEIPIPPYHKRIRPTKPQKEPVCLTCHLAQPHIKEERTRAFLNMHISYVSCEVCHFRPEGLSLEAGWLSYDDGRKKAFTNLTGGISFSNKIALFYKGEAVMVFKDNQFPKEIGEKWKRMALDEKAELKARLHKPLSKKGYECRECHSKEQKVLDLMALGFPANKIMEMEQNKIAWFIDRCKKDGKPILLTGLVE